MLGTGMPHSGVMTKNSGNTGFLKCSKQGNGVNRAGGHSPSAWLAGVGRTCLACIWKQENKYGNRSILAGHSA